MRPVSNQRGSSTIVVLVVMLCACAQTHEPAPVDAAAADVTPVSCEGEGEVCDTGEACIEGRIDCASGRPECVALGPIPGCPEDPGCGLPCETGEPCVAGVIDCSTGACVPSGTQPAGTACGPGLACDDSGGCTVCVPGGSCETGSPCHEGSWDCSTGTPVCAAIQALPEGTPCGAAGFCDPASPTCSECVLGSACYVMGCFVGTVDCSSGEPQCMFDHTLPAGVACGDGGTCNPLGLCRE